LYLQIKYEIMVSVIIPNYNHAPFLKKRIESILNQTYQDFELIILDDCSSDNSRDIIESYRYHPKVSQIIYNQTNSGSTFKQWRKGIEISKGDYIWIAESDDFADSVFLERIMASYKKNNCVLCFCRSNIIDNQDNILWTKPPIIESNYINTIDFLKYHLMHGNEIYNASMVVFRKKGINEKIWDKLIRYKYCGDWFFWSEFMKNNISQKIGEIKEPLNYFRTHKKNISNKSEHEGLTFIEGFPISKSNFNYLGKNQFREFCEKWYHLWMTYRVKYQFSIKTNLKIFFLFLLRQQQIAILEIKRIWKRTINGNK